MVQLRLFLADDHEIVRYGLRTLLESQFGWTVIGEAADGQNAIEGVLALQPDIAVMDIAMPRIDGLQATRRILLQRLQGRAHENSDSFASRVQGRYSRGY